MRCLLPTIILLSVFALLNSANAKEPTYGPFEEALKTAHFSINVSKDECQKLLSKLPPVTIETDKGKILRQLTKRLNKEAQELTEEERDEIAEKIYTSDIRPVLDPRVEKFNELMNQAIEGDKISAGFIAFAGLAKSMATTTPISAITVSGTFVPNSEETGEWSWNTFSGGTSESYRSISGSIDETINIDLKPYGIEGHLDFPVICYGEVRLEKKYRKSYHFVEKPRGARETKVYLTPKMNMTASKSISKGAKFKINGESYSSERKEFAYPIFNT